MIKQEVDDEIMEVKPSSEVVPLENRRLSIYQPIVYGNTARHLEKPNSENHTHEWILFLKPYFKNCDMTKFVRKVS